MHLPGYCCNDCRYILLKDWSKLFKFYSRIDSSTLFGYNYSSCRYMNSSEGAPNTICRQMACHLSTLVSWQYVFIVLLQNIGIRYNSVRFSHDYRFIFYFCRWFKSRAAYTFLLIVEDILMKYTSLIFSFCFSLWSLSVYCDL